MNQKIDFVKESFTPAEVAILERYFTNTDLPVFGLVNLPDVVKGALFARYSRSNKSLRRLFLDEFYSEGTLAEQTTGAAKAGEERASALYDKMILDFGDDSVAQLGGAHIACEQVSNILTKILERGRLAAYLEQSTRYVYYNARVEGHYHYMTPPEIRDTPCEAPYRAAMDSLFDTYSAIQAQLIPLLEAKYPQKKGQSTRVWESTTRAKACDIVRGLLPASTRSNMGIYGNGQYFEYLLVKMYATGNAEAVAYADMMLAELRKIIPAFLTRVDRPDRGGAWSDYLRAIDTEMRTEIPALFDNAPVVGPCAARNEVKLIGWDDDALDRVLRAILFEYSAASDDEIRRRIATLTEARKIEIVQSYAGTRHNRRHKPGRAFETTSYHFEVLSDYGAFRDLQRHRMLTIEWQKISPSAGYVLPHELDEYPGLRTIYESALQNVAKIYDEIKSHFGPDPAQYVMPFAYRVRYQITMNLREAFHFIELRSQKQGHHSYRRVSQDMWRLIAASARQPWAAELMNFVDTNMYDLAREDAEASLDRKQAQRAGAKP